MKEDNLMKKCKAIALVMGVAFFGIAAMLFGAAAVIYSASPAQADPAPQTIQTAGKYQMQLSTVLTSTDKSYWYVLVWDTETGRSKMYYGNISDGIKLAHSMYNLPSSPL